MSGWIAAGYAVASGLPLLVIAATVCLPYPTNGGNGPRGGARGGGAGGAGRGGGGVGGFMGLGVFM